MTSKARFVVMTAPAPGAIGIVQLVGACDGILRELTGVAEWPVGRMRLVDLGGIDEGLAARLDPDVAQLMPHGGPRVMQRLARRLVELGAEPSRPGGADPLALYPEAHDRLEALALATIARAASPLAIDLLLDQPRRWRKAPAITEADRERSRRLDRLVHPPSIVVAGPANAGKSTLVNALAGRAISITHDEPGTTRDAASGRLELAGLVVNWYDTPGLRATTDPVERRAVELAKRLMNGADLLVAMTDAEQEWPRLPREPDLRIASKSDLAPRGDADLAVSAVTGAGLEALVTTVRDALVRPEDLTHPGPWIFAEGVEE